MLAFIYIWRGMTHQHMKYWFNVGSVIQNTTESIVMNSICWRNTKIHKIIYDWSIEFKVSKSEVCMHGQCSICLKNCYRVSPSFILLITILCLVQNIYNLPSSRAFLFLLVLQKVKKNCMLQLKEGIKLFVQFSRIRHNLMVLLSLTLNLPTTVP